MTITTKAQTVREPSSRSPRVADARLDVMVWGWRPLIG